MGLAVPLTFVFPFFSPVSKKFYWSKPTEKGLTRCRAALACYIGLIPSHAITIINGYCHIPQGARC